jgi:hypothetical protein
VNKLKLTMALLTVLGALAVSPAATADERNQKTVFTFTGPVEIPGRVLPAGTYVFKLFDSPANRHIVQVFSKDETHVFGTFLAIPDYRLHASEKTIITFSERPAGTPEAIKAWFYPGRNYGHEFVYPKNEAMALAQANHTPVPFTTEELAPEMAKPSLTLKGPEILAFDLAPLMAETATGQEVEIAEAFEVTDPHSELPEKLPVTATSLPLIGLAGVVSLAAAGGLRYAAARAK